MPGATFLAGERVALRTVEEEDLSFLQRWDNDPTTRRLAGGDALPVTLADERAARERAGERGAVQLLVAVADEGIDPDASGGHAADHEGGERAGYVELDPVDHVASAAELGLWLAPAYRGEGYAAEVLELVVGYAFEELRLHRVSATAFATNERAMARLRATGFREEGVTREDAFVGGEHADTHHFGLLEDEWRERG